MGLPPDEPFSAGALRRNFGYFAVGKIGSGIIGIGVVVLMVRLLSEPDYGSYVSLVALLEIVLLVSNAGSYPIAQRYFTDAMLDDNRVWLGKLVVRAFALRAGSLVLVALALGVASASIADGLRLPGVAAALPLYALVIVFEGSARFIDLVFEGMLEQRRAQVCAIVRSGTRLAILFAMLRLGGDLSLLDAVKVDLAGAAVGLTVSLAMLRRTVSSISPHRPAPDAADPFSWRRMTGFALPLYLAQIVTQAYGPDTVKLVIGRMMGAMEVAAFGFAHALSLILQRYLPAQLLLGLVRPALVARQARGAPNEQLARAGNLILKINHFLLVPVAAFVGVGGTELVLLVSKGKHALAGGILFWLVALLLLQALHVVLSMLATALEDRRAVLFATLAATPGVVAGILLANVAGIGGMLAGLWASELLWCATARRMLSARGFQFPIDWRGWCKLLAAGAIAALGALPPGWPAGLAGVCLQAGVVGTVFLVACRLLRPFTAEERAQINRMLPKPVFVF